MLNILFKKIKLFLSVLVSNRNFINMLFKEKVPDFIVIKKADNRVVSLSRIGWLNFSD